MATRNYFQAKRQKEMSRKTRQDKKAQRKQERTGGTDLPPAADGSEAAEQPADQPASTTP